MKMRMVILVNNYDIYKSWEELDDKIESLSSFAPLVYLAFDSDNVRLYIQNSIEQNAALVIALRSDLELELNMDLIGFTVETKVEPTIDNNQKCIVISNNDKNQLNIFKAFSASLFEKLETSYNFDDIKESILNVIDEYKNYFNGNKKILSSSEQQGLIGELKYILEEINNNNFDVIKFWEGIYKNKHDFVFDKKAIEIKTTKNQSRLDIRISNENQLLSMNNEKLDLVVYRLEKIEAGKSVYDLANEIFSKINNKYKSIMISKLIKAGMDPFETNYEKFRFIEKYTFEVKDDFPILNKSSLNDRIFDVKYTLNLDGVSSIKEEYTNE